MLSPGNSTRHLPRSSPVRASREPYGPDRYRLLLSAQGTPDAIPMGPKNARQHLDVERIAVDQQDTWGGFLEHGKTDLRATTQRIAAPCACSVMLIRLRRRASVWPEVCYATADCPCYIPTVDTEKYT